MAELRKITLDALIAGLQARRAAGLAGNTVVATVLMANNCFPVRVSLELAPRVETVSKEEFAKGWDASARISRGGVVFY